MTININLPELKELHPRILVMGVGGAGGNAINRMIDAGLQGVEFVAVNTDAQDLKMNKAQSKIQLGTNLTNGLGAGARHDIGQAAADESLNEIINYIQGSNMVFITAGMGGGTGTGASHVIARAAKELNILTVGVITLPFSYEGPKRMRRALEGLEELKKHLDTNIVVPNQNLFKIANEKTTFEQSFELSNNVLQHGVQSITDLMVRPGLINLDFADVETVMSGMGKAMMGTGEAEGENRAIEATSLALDNPLIDEYSLKGAKGLLVNITGGKDLALFEVDQAINKIRAEVDPEAELIFGSIQDEALNEKIRVSIVATALDGQGPDVKNPVVSMVHHIHNRSTNHNNVINTMGSTKPLESIQGATALNMEVSAQEDIFKSPDDELKKLEDPINEISLESATYLQNLEENGESNQKQEAVLNNEDNSINQDLSFENDSTPNLFSGTVETNSNNQEQKEPELFENQEDEDNFEIPAFLRRQKN